MVGTWERPWALRTDSSGSVCGYLTVIFTLSNTAQEDMQYWYWVLVEST
jgi:hypothetical protein